MYQYQIKTIILSSLLSTVLVAQADDSEIFFNESIKHVKPNVIFLLDGSGSMAWDPDPSMSTRGSNTRGKDSRMEILKSSLETLFNDPNTKEIRAGIIRFSDANITQNTLWNVQSVIDMDDSTGNDLINQVTTRSNGDNTVTLQQPVLTDIDDGWQSTNGTNRACLMQAKRAEYTQDCGRGTYYRSITLSNNIAIGYRFNGILLNSPTATNNVKSAYLNIYIASGSRNTGINLTMDEASNAPFFTENWNTLSSRINESKDSTQSFSVQNVSSSTVKPNDGSCIIIASNPARLQCNITTLIQNKIKKSDWKAGNAIAFYLTKPNSSNTFYFREQGTNYNAYLEITADSSMVSDKTAFNNKNQLISQAYTITPYNGTYIGYALYEVARYISNYTKKSGGTGPYHANTLGNSPLLEGCQLSHIILMTDGVPSASNASQLATYMNQNQNSCRIFTADDTSQTQPDVNNRGQTNEFCARAFVSWLARVDQSTVFNNGANYIYTNTIGFAMPDEGQNSTTAQSYLQDLAKYGKGKPYNVKTKNDLIDAFKQIISDARSADSPSASGSVTMSAQSRYQQRTEVFYSFYASDSFDYWSGNMKRFGLKYIKTKLTDGSDATRPILVGKDLITAAMSADGIIKNTISSFWNNSNNDGGRVDAGGVVGMLMYDRNQKNEEIANPTKRNMLLLTANQSTTEALPKLKDSYSSITTSDLGLTGSNTEAIKLGLLDFIRGYTYKEGGSSEAIPYTSKKIGDSVRASVSLINYNCAQPDAKGRSDITSCAVLNQIALLASNDGFIRGYDTTTGEAVYEIIPSEMLPLIQKLQERKVLNFQTARSYGLDGTVVTYLSNNSDYVKDGKAYAYVTAGRGGKLIYILDISNKESPMLVKVISNNSSGFENLGYTWSTPVLGKIRSEGNIIPVLVFGGGYDKSVDEVDDSALRTSNIGNAIYIVNAINGELIQKIQASGMDYSIPSRIALVTDDGKDNENKQKLITDIITGDTGGQVWRFKINNGAPNTVDTFSIIPQGNNGLIAKLSGTSTADARKFFQTPSVSIQTVNGVKTLVIGLGSGNKIHPVSKDVNDRIYILNYPLDSANTQVLTEDDIATVSSNGQGQPINADKLNNGFMIKLTGAGEKVVSDGIVAFNRIVFNTYTATPTDIKTCKPSTGKQRTYNYDTATGISLLTTAFEESSIAALPPDVTFYCDSAFCTIIASPKQLADGDDALSKGKNGRDPWIDKNPDGGTIYVKAGWTDIFNITK